MYLRAARIDAPIYNRSVSAVGYPRSAAALAGMPWLLYCYRTGDGGKPVVRAVETRRATFYQTVGRSLVALTGKRRYDRANLRQF